MAEPELQLQPIQPPLPEEQPPVNEGEAVAGAPVADPHALWIHRNHARLAKKYAKDKTFIQTLKFISPIKPTSQRVGEEEQTHSHHPHYHHHGSPSQQLRADRAEWDSPLGPPLVLNESSDDQPPISSLDEDEQSGPSSHQTRLRQQRRRKPHRGNELGSANEDEHKEDISTDSASNSDSDEHKESRPLANNTREPLASDNFAGSLPAIIIDPFCSLFTPAQRPHLKPDASMSSAMSGISVASLPPAPAIWTTDYPRHTIRCILADGQIHTIAGGGENNGPDAPLSGYQDGTGTSSALFSKPRGLVLHPISGEIFIADSANHCIRCMTSPRLVGAALKRAGKEIEDSSSFRTLRDPTVDPKEEELRLQLLAKKKQTGISASATFPTPELASSLRIILELFLPLIIDYVGFEVRTIAGTPGISGCRDTALDSRGCIVQPAQFKYPIGLCLRMIGPVEDEIESSSSPSDPTSSNHPLSSIPTASNVTSYELLVSDAGNGCIRRIKPNPFGPPLPPSPRRPRSVSPFRTRSISPTLQLDEESTDRGFIVETIRAFVPIRCCHTSWMPQDKQQSSNQQEEHKESSSHSPPGPSASSPPTASSSSSFGSTLLENLSSSPSRFLHEVASSGGANREYITFQYPIGIALRLERNSRREKQVWEEEQAEFGCIYTVKDGPQSNTNSPQHQPLNHANGDEATSSNQLISTSAVAASPDSSLPPLPSRRHHATSYSLLIVDARASCIYSMDLDGTPGSVKRLAGSDDGGWGFLDGSGSRSRFCRPSGVSVDQRTGLIFIADAGNSCIRTIDLHSNRVATLAGHPRRVGCTDGPAFAATFYAPLAIALTPCPFFPHTHPQTLYIAGGFRQGLRRIIRCECRWTYETS